MAGAGDGAHGTHSHHANAATTATTRTILPSGLTPIKTEPLSEITHTNLYRFSSPDDPSASMRYTNGYPPPSPTHNGYENAHAGHRHTYSAGSSGGSSTVSYATSSSAPAMSYGGHLSNTHHHPHQHHPAQPSSYSDGGSVVDSGGGGSSSSGYHHVVECDDDRQHGYHAGGPDFSPDMSPVDGYCPCRNNPTIGHSLIALSNQLQNTIACLRQFGHHHPQHRHEGGGMCRVYRRALELQHILQFVSVRLIRSLARFLTHTPLYVLFTQRCFYSNHFISRPTYLSSAAATPTRRITLLRLSRYRTLLPARVPPMTRCLRQRAISSLHSRRPAHRTTALPLSQHQEGDTIHRTSGVLASMWQGTILIFRCSRRSIRATGELLARFKWFSIDRIKLTSKSGHDPFSIAIGIVGLVVFLLRLDLFFCLCICSVVPFLTPSSLSLSLPISFASIPLSVSGCVYCGHFYLGPLAHCSFLVDVKVSPSDTPGHSKTFLVLVPP
jgi:hypothetical protein